MMSETQENARRAAMGLPPVTQTRYMSRGDMTPQDIERYLATVRQSGQRLYSNQADLDAYVERVKKLVMREYGSTRSTMEGGDVGHVSQTLKKMTEAMTSVVNQSTTDRKRVVEASEREKENAVAVNEKLSALVREQTRTVSLLKDILTEIKSSSGGSSLISGILGGGRSRLLGSILRTAIGIGIVELGVNAPEVGQLMQMLGSVDESGAEGEGGGGQQDATAAAQEEEEPALTGEQEEASNARSEEIYQQLLAETPEDLRGDPDNERDLREEARDRARQEIRERSQPAAQQTLQTPATAAGDVTPSSYAGPSAKAGGAPVAKSPATRVAAKTTPVADMAKGPPGVVAPTINDAEPTETFIDRVLNVKAREMTFKADQFVFKSDSMIGQDAFAAAPGLAAPGAQRPDAGMVNPAAMAVPQPGGTNALMRPVGGQITSGFGPRAMGLHDGIDFGVPEGTPVAAAASGTVTRVDSQHGGYGNWVEVRHADGITTRYAHLSSIGVQPGQTVAQGDTIGLSGNTGKSTGPHLHFEVRRDGRPVDPAPLIRAGQEVEAVAGSPSGEDVGRSGVAAASNAQPAAQMMDPAPASGMQVEAASRENEYATRAAPTQNVTNVVGMGATPDNQGVSTPTYGLDPSDPGNVEPPDAAERYARLFGLAA